MEMCLESKKVESPWSTVCFPFNTSYMRVSKKLMVHQKGVPWGLLGKEALYRAPIYG